MLCLCDGKPSPCAHCKLVMLVSEAAATLLVVSEAAAAHFLVGEAAAAHFLVEVATPHSMFGSLHFFFFSPSFNVFLNFSLVLKLCLLFGILYKVY